MDTGKAFIVISSILLISILANSFFVQSNQDLSGQAIDVLDEPKIQTQNSTDLMEWYNPEKYPRTPFTRTDDYQRFKNQVSGKIYSASDLDKTSEAEESRQERVPVDYYIITNPELYSETKDILNDYLEEVYAYEKYNSEIVICDDCSHESLRAALNEGYQNGLKGAFLIGDLPYAWMQLTSGSGEFPTVYYYMDLDGEWIDTDSDGVYEEPQGETEPEIFIGLLRTDKMTLTGESEKDLLENYFNKVSAYKNDKLNFGDESLLIMDNVFQNQFGDGEQEFINTFNFVSIYKELETTSVLDYDDKLAQQYNAVYVFAHSDPWVHGFSEEDEEGQGCEWYNPAQPNPNAVCYNSFSNEDLLNIQPHSLFYFLKGCAVGRFTEQDNLAGWYTLQPEGGIITFAPTEVISSLSDMENYFDNMQEGKSMGESFLALPTTISLRYHMALFGDPTVRLKEKYQDQKEFVNNNNYANQENTFQLLLSNMLREITPISVNIYLNDEKIQSFSQQLTGKELIEIDFTPELGFNNLKVCSVWGDERNTEKCTEQGIIASSTIKISHDNLLFDCSEQGLNPLVGENITYQDTFAGILIENRNNVTIQNCDISNYDELIRVANSTNIIIKDSKFSSPKSGQAFIFFAEQGFDTEKGYLGPSSNIHIYNNTFGSGDSITISGYFSDSVIEDNIFGGTSGGVTHLAYYNSNIIFKNNYACPRTEELMNQIICEGNPLIIKESTGNNFDTYIGCENETWPIYGEHFLYCNETWEKTQPQELDSIRK